MDLAANSWAREAAVECACAVLEGRLCIFEGCQKLADLASALVENWVDDPDFVLFGGIASETDGSPIGATRALWSAEGLAREDRSLIPFEAAVAEQVRAACRNVVARFSEKPSASA